MAKKKENTAVATKMSLKDILHGVKLGDDVIMAVDDNSAPTEWISTGSYSLNKIITGDPRRGIPVGRITALAGEPSTGKSYICEKIIKNAIADGFKVILIDTENGYDTKKMEANGINLDEIVMVKSGLISDVKNITIPLLRTIRETDENAKMLVIIDSLGAMTTEKQQNDDIANEKVGHDQGMKAKEMKGLANVFLQESRKLKFTVVVTNHIYLKPGQNPSVPPEQIFTGGNGWIYACSTIIFLSKKQEKEEEYTKKEFSGKSIKAPTGMFIYATTKKNRFIPEGQLAEMYINFVKGPSKWYGLADDAAEFEYITKMPGKICLNFNNHVMIKEAELYKDGVFDPIFDELCNKIYEKLRFKTIEECNEGDDITNDMGDKK